MKVLFTYTLAERLGGSEDVLWSILRNLDRSRVAPVVVFFAPGPFEREVAALGIPTHVVPLGRFRQVGLGARAILRLARILRDERPELVVNFILKAQLYGAPAAVLAGFGRRILWWQHDIPGRQPFDRLAATLPARAILTSSGMAADAQRRRRPRRRSVAVLPGIPEPRPVPAEEIEALRERLGIERGDPVVGIVGRLQEWKGQHRFLEALARLREAGREVRGLVVGGTQHLLDPEYELHLRHLVAELGLEGRVTFAGQVADVVPYLQLMDVMVSASDPEPFGLVLLEAMALEVPIVAVDAGGPREILDGGRYGVLVPTGAPEHLAAGVDRVLADPGLGRSLAGRARRRYAERFTAERMTRELESRLEELAPARR